MKNISNNPEPVVIPNLREQLRRAEIRKQITITDSNKGTIYILCPANLSHDLYQHFSHKNIESTFPKRAIDGKNPDDELIVVTATLDRGKTEVEEFVSKLEFPN